MCSGIEAASVAWTPLGWTPVAFAEIEKFPSAVLAHHYPEVPNLGDITKFREWPDLAFDVLAGGTPCQSFSVAGLRKGMADPRGNLALTYLAITDRYRPKWVVWENVPGVRSVDGGRAFGAFLGGLGELGYGWAYRSLDAQYFGLAQRRERVFVVGHLGDWRRAAAVLFEPESLRGDSPPRRETGEGVTPILEAGARTGRSTDDIRAGSGIGDPGDPMFTLQSGKQHAVAPTLPSRNRSGGGFGTDFDCDGGLIANALHASDGHHAVRRDADNIIAMSLNAKGGTGRSDAESETFEVAALQGGVRRLTPRECSRLQGLPDSYLDVTYRGKPAADGPKYKAIGNSMAVPVVAWLGRRIQLVEQEK